MAAQRSSDRYTPMMQQYLSIKEQYPDALLLYRMGDFYETFFEDAHIVSRELEIVLTGRDGGIERVAMAGIPHHALRNYVTRLLEKGYRVAICEQAELPGKGKKLLRREVTHVLTPGTVIEWDWLTEKRNNYLAAISGGREAFGLAYADITTGEFQVTQLAGTRSAEQLQMELRRLAPAEVLVPTDPDRLFGLRGPRLEETEWNGIVPPDLPITWRPRPLFDAQAGRQALMRHFQVRTLEGFGCQDLPLAVAAAAALVAYVGDTQRSALVNLNGLSTYTLGDFLVMDAVTQRNLELLQTARDGTFRGSLLWVLDQTRTAMGARILRHWLQRPLLDPDRIGRRLDAVEELKENGALRGELRGVLAEVRDLERLSARLQAGGGHARDLLAVRQSLAVMPRLVELLASCRSSLLREVDRLPAELQGLADHIGSTLVDDPPLLLTEGGLIRPGVHADLDELREMLGGDKAWISALEQQERERTGIRSLRVSFNRNFGYFIEVTHANRHLVPDDYVRKQTLVNAERFITPALKDREGKIFQAEERIGRLEYEVFSQLRAEAAAHAPVLQGMARSIASIDALSSLAEIAARHRYERPQVDDSTVISLRAGRHPVVERLLPVGTFVPNDAYLDTETNQLVVLTGPNMSGKSVYIKQVALIVLLAQMGSFVPAQGARIGVADRIFTRIGAVEDLPTGQSTFLVEMTETANILHNATLRSLILLDEVGRGTSTFDGLSIAWAVGEFLCDAVGARTLFATHYHELTKLEEHRPSVRNYRVDVRETDKEVIFLHQVVPGGADRSYGIEVARLAGLPGAVVERARGLQADIEKRSRVSQSLKRMARTPEEVIEQAQQLSLFQTED